MKLRICRIDGTLGLPVRIIQSKFRKVEYTLFVGIWPLDKIEAFSYREALDYFKRSDYSPFRNVNWETVEFC